MTKKTYDQSLKLCQAKSFKIELIDNKSPFEAFGIGVDIYPPSYKLVFYLLSIFSSFCNILRVWCTKCKGLGAKIAIMKSLSNPSS